MSPSEAGRLPLLIGLGATQPTTTSAAGSSSTTTTTSSNVASAPVEVPGHAPKGEASSSSSSSSSLAPCARPATEGQRDGAAAKHVTTAKRLGQVEREVCAPVPLALKKPPLAR